MSLKSKFRLDPVAYCADSRHWLLRGPGGVVARALIRYRFIETGLRDPVEALQQATWPGAKWLGKALGAKGTHRRLALIERHGHPKVSVVMAARNAQDTITKAIQSLNGQTYSHWELIVVDDASSDKTGAIANAAAKADKRISVLRGKTRKGAAISRNKGLMATKGDFITFLDADDICHPERLERQLAALLSDPKPVICTCSYSRVNADNRTVNINDRAVRKCVISMLFRKSPVLERVGYFEPLTIGEDSEYLERIKASFGDEAEIQLFKILYYAGFSQGSAMFSGSDLTVLDDANIRHSLPPERLEQLRTLRAKHDLIRKGERDPFVPAGS